MNRLWPPQNPNEINGLSMGLGFLWAGGYLSNEKLENYQQAGSNPCTNPDPGQLKSVGAVNKSGLIRIAVLEKKKSGRNPAKTRGRHPHSWYMYVYAMGACGSL